MRFIENGPSIPDELLNARDEGRVVFFCGAGVSQARADLPDFFGLAEAVIRELGVPKDSNARKVLEKARKIGEELDVTGLISADRVFGLLEREFRERDIQAAVAKSLAPQTAEPELSAHQILLRLARTPESRTQLVTTNFDRLFEACDGTVASYLPPRLPNPSRYDDFDGIVCLHGRANDDYSGAEDGGFVLSSSDFGYAYLSEGWAAEFFRDVVQEYIVAFIGYSADDPPIHYLLEGLRRTPDSSRDIYAFQAEESAESVARWHHKGVEVIPYSPAGKHRALWETVEQWARRADEPRSWCQGVLSLAMAGPEKLQPHQRGQVAHIVSTHTGARDFLARTPPAEWLCVFDASCRYAKPTAREWHDLDSPVVDPFVLYGLDSDATPERGGRENVYASPEIPSDAWEAFLPNRIDCQDLPIESLPALRGHWAGQAARLPKRLECLGAWITDVSHQPATVWWAARQDSLHPGIRERILWRTRTHHGSFGPAVLDGWRYLLDTWEATPDTVSRSWPDLRRRIEREGWGPATVRRFAEIMRPYLRAKPATFAQPVPPRMAADLRLRDLVEVEVECPDPPHDAVFPDECLAQVVREMRKNMELAVHLCEETGDGGRFRISPIVPDPSPDIDGYGRSHGLSGCAMQFAELFDRLAELDIQKAQHELHAWMTDDDTVFSRLRLWVSGKSELMSPHACHLVLQGLSDDAFWSRDHQRDLLLVLSQRWNQLSKTARKQIERRLLRGPPRWAEEEDTAYEERISWATLQRLQWLADSHCEFSFDLDRVMTERRLLAPSWRPEYADKTVESQEIRGGSVRTRTEHAELLRIPIGSVLARARGLSGRTANNACEDHDPFAGLCRERPVRAYRALTHAARQGEFPEWAWRTFLLSDGRKEDSPKLSAAVAERLCRFPEKVLISVLYPLTWWLQKTSKALSRESAESFDRVLSRLINVLEREPSAGHSGVMGTRGDRDWVMEALNSPVGHIVRALLEDPRVSKPDVDAGLPTDWLGKLGRLLALNGDPRRHTIVMASHDLGWLHHYARTWTTSHVLSVLDGEDEEDKQALWAGLFWQPEGWNAELFSRLRPGFLELTRQGASAREGHVRSLAFVMLWAWTPSGKEDGEGWVSDSDFRDALLHGGDDFRSQVLWQIRGALGDEDESTRKKWSTWTVELLRRVWPRQRIVKSQAMAARLCELLLSDGRSFAELVDAVLPLLTEISSGARFHLDLRDGAKDIVEQHAERLLAVLHAVLSDQVPDWPYGMGDVLENIGKTHADLLLDTRLQELQRRWNAR